MDPSSSNLGLERDEIQVTGEISTDTNWLIFHPHGALLDGSYNAGAALCDKFGNRSAFYQFSFMIDRLPPPVPQVSTVVSPTTIDHQLVCGTKETGSGVLLNDDEVVSPSETTNWQTDVQLVNGANLLSFSLVDLAGNESAATNITIVFDDTVPGQVTNLVAIEEGTGTEITLSWTEYNEEVNGSDIVSYEIHSHNESFTNVAGTDLVAVQESGTQTYVITGLVRSVTNFYAVVPVDAGGLFHTNVISVGVAPRDTIPPNNPADITFDCSATDLSLSWRPVSDPHFDLAGCRIYMPEDSLIGIVPPEQNFFQVSGLNPASAYDFKVSSVDNDGNESSGIVGTGYTLLNNPSGLSALPYDTTATLSWSQVTPLEYLGHYSVYVSDTYTTNALDMDRKTTTTSTEATVGGLANGTTNYVAVTSVNKAGGENTAVEPVTVVPRADTEAPVIDSLHWNDAPLAGSITAPGTWSVQVTDPAGISNVSFHIDGEANIDSHSTGTTFTCPWDPVYAVDGNHMLYVSATDAAGNSTQIETNFIVMLSLPAIPSISSPSDGSELNNPSVTLVGQADNVTESVGLSLNGEMAGFWSVVSGSGAFTANVLLKEGSNTLSVIATNRVGQSGLSVPVNVIIDTSIPDPPSDLDASSREDGVVRLTWTRPQMGKVSGYRVYRSPSSFTTPMEAEMVHWIDSPSTFCSDLPPEDGEYFYRVITINSVGTESALSEETTGISDSEAPYAVGIEYTTNGEFDGDRYGPGRVAFSLEVSESLVTTPFLSFTRSGGSPVTVSLISESELVYTGLLEITENTASATAYASFSGYDPAGNRGTDILSGETIVIDTEGPTVQEFVVQPVSPIRNSETNPCSVTVVLSFSEEDLPVGTPRLDYYLSLSDTGKVQIALSPHTQASWVGSFILPGSAGLPTEELNFLYQGVDSLGNYGQTMPAEVLCQVYQGELPPLDAPAGLRGQALPGGQVQLLWNEVTGADSYAVYREGVSQSGPVKIADVGEAAYEETASDGTNAYAVASVRRANNQAATSIMSETVLIVSDSMAPLSPANLTIVLEGRGVVLSWDSPPDEDDLTYSIYRSTEPVTTTSVHNLDALIDGVSATEAVDDTPLQRQVYYAVEAVDNAGNRSVPSESVYTNISLLPVSSLSVVKKEDALPEVSWSHTAADSISGFNFYVGFDGEELLVNNDVLGADTLSAKDTGYDSRDRCYRICAVDLAGTNAVESVGRSTVLPLLSIESIGEDSINRGVMNRLDYLVRNNGEINVSNITLETTVLGKAHVSDVFELGSGASSEVSVVVGGYADLAETVTITNMLVSMADGGESARIISSNQLSVGQDTFTCEIRNGELIRGAAAAASFVFHNTFDVEVEIVTAVSSGSEESGEISLWLEDADGFVLAAGGLLQNTGTDVTTLSDGTTVACIHPGESFTSDEIPIVVPSSAPENLVLRLNIDSIHYNYGQENHVSIEGFASTRQLTVGDTDYSAVATNCTPSSSNGDSPILISGCTYSRDSDGPEPNAAVVLTISKDGFERSYEVASDANGEWSYNFQPEEQEFGHYTVWASHPDIADKPLQSSFTINRVLLSPSIIRFAAPRNYEQDGLVTATVGTGLTLTNLQISCFDEDQTNDVLDAGVHFTSGPQVELVKGGESVDLPFSVWFDNAAPTNGCLVMRVFSDDAPDGGWGYVLLHYELSEAQPSLFWTPNYVEVGVAVSNILSTTITIENNGLADLEDVSIEMVTTNESAAPEWVLLNGPESLGVIEQNDSRELNLAFAPRDTSLIGIHEFRLRITSANYVTKHVNIFVAVDASGKGDAIFKVIDLYYGYDDGSGANTGVDNARIRLEKQDGSLLTTNVTTDTMGEVWVRDLPVGVYNYKVDSDAHHSLTGTLDIQPGITVTREVFLDCELVTVEWSVVPSTIEDTYEIVLEATFETDVPAAVVLASPMSVTMPDMAPGDVFNGEIELRNHGLIRANAVRPVIPDADDYFRFELMCDPPSTIEAASSVTMPYRITCLSPLDQGPGGSETYAGTVDFTYETTCAGGSTISDTASFYYMGSTDSQTEPVIWGYAPGEGTLMGGGPGEYFSASSSSSVSGTDLEGFDCDEALGLTIAEPNLCMGCTGIVQVTINGCSYDGCPTNYLVTLTCDPSAELSKVVVLCGVGISEDVELVPVKGSKRKAVDEVIAYGGGMVVKQPYTVVEIENLVIEPLLGVGDSTHPKLDITPNDWPVTWSISDRYCTGGELKAEIDPSSGEIRVDSDSGSGWIVVRAEAEDVECECWIERKVRIGCGRCPSCDTALGEADLAVDSIHSQFFLGEVSADESAGRLYIYSDEMTNTLYTPSALEFASVSETPVVVQGDYGILRQVRVPQGLADIVTLSDEMYELRFYYSSQVGAANNEGIFSVEGHPFTVWRVQNPGVSDEGHERLQITRVVDNYAVTNMYSWNAENTTWMLSRGNGLICETKRERTFDDEGRRTVTSEIADADGTLASKMQETYHDFSWGEDVTQRVVYAGEEELVTTFAYCDDSEKGAHRRLVKQTNPDGSWFTNRYNASGALEMHAECWKDSSPEGIPIQGQMQGRVQWYYYSPVDPLDEGTSRTDSYRTMVETIDGVVVAKTYKAFIEDEDGGLMEIEDVCASRIAGYGDEKNLRTVRTYHPTNDLSLARSGKLASVLYPDGRRNSYAYVYGTYMEDEDPSLCVFIEGTGASIRQTITHGTGDRHEGIPGKSTIEVLVTSPQGNSVIEETYVVVEGGTELIAREVRYFNDLGRRTRVVHKDGTITDSQWACCGKENETDRYGVERTFVRDDLARVTAEIKHGIGTGAYPAQDDIEISYEIDASGRRVNEETTGGGLSVRSKSLYDLAGRITNHVDTAGLVTTYSYPEAGRTKVVVNPSGLERVTDSYTSGQTKSVAEDGVLREFYDYGVNSDGTRWTRVWKGKDGTNSLSWTRTVMDMAGRTLRTESPGFSAGSLTVLTNSFAYNNNGQLVRTTAQGIPDTLYEQGELGDTVKTGLDVNGDGLLTLDSSDRITARKNHYVKDEAGDWWALSASSIYTSSDGDVITNQLQLTRLTGLSSGKASEIVNVDVFGNKTRSVTSVNRSAKIVTETTTYPDSTNSAVAVTVNGLVVSSEGRTGITYDYGNDALGRRVSITDPRTGTRTTHFNDKGQVDYVMDAMSNRTSYAYHPGTGHLVGLSNAVGETAWHEYGSKGELLARWGDAVYPVRYEYRDEGQVAAMYTLRDTSVTISNYASFLENEASFDKTIWLYDETTGLLTNKVYADGKGVSYTYTPEGKLKGRMWARGQVQPAQGQVPEEWVGSDRVITTYSYTNTGELVGIEYSDGTPGVSMTLDHLGRNKTVSDAQGTRVFHYSPEGQLTNETLGDVILGRTYDPLGRANGLSVVPVPDLDATCPYRVTYGHDGVGRFNSLESVVMGDTNAYSYGYTRNSDLVAEVSLPEAGFRARKYYEPHRNLISEVLNQYGGSTVSRYNYLNDAVGRRTRRTDLSPAAPAALTNVFRYNPRSEVTNAVVPVPDGGPVPASTNVYGFAYDNIGNRLSASSAPLREESYLSNELNQYTGTGAEGVTNAWFYDSDGNLTNDGVRVYTWNAENRLKTVEPLGPAAGDRKLTLGYDYMGRRFRKVVSTYDGSAWQVTATNDFIYDGWNVIAEVGGQESEVSTNFYTWGLDLSGTSQGAGGIGGLLSITCPSGSNTQTHLYCFDANGNVVQLINADDGSLTSQYHYTPFGNIVSVGESPGDDPNPFRFSTKYHDEEVNQYYYGYRHYDPVHGRWRSRDPIEERGGVNLYVFVRNRPVDRVDPVGRITNDPGTFGWETYTPFSYESYLHEATSVGGSKESGNLQVSFDDIRRHFHLKGASVSYSLPLKKLKPIPVGAAVVEQELAAFLKMRRCCNSDGTEGSEFVGGLYYSASIGFGTIFEIVKPRSERPGRNVLETLKNRALSRGGILNSKGSLSSILPCCENRLALAFELGLRGKAAGLLWKGEITGSIGEVALQFPDPRNESGIRWSFDQSRMEHELGITGLGARVEAFGSGNGSLSIVVE